MSNSISEQRCLYGTVIKKKKKILEDKVNVGKMLVHNKQHSCKSQVTQPVLIRKILQMNYLIGFNKVVYS